MARVQILMLLALLAGLAGCRGAGLPADPLFANRKPMESKGQAGPVAATPFFEPTPPVPLASRAP